MDVLSRATKIFHKNKTHQNRGCDMKAKIGLVVFAMLWLTHCGGLTGTGSSSNAGTEIGSSGVSLTSNDFSTVGVCSGSLDVTTTTIKNEIGRASCRERV